MVEAEGGEVGAAGLVEVEDGDGEAGEGDEVAEFGVVAEVDEVAGGTK